MNNLTFALPSGYDYDINKFTRQVKTKSWAKQYYNKFNRLADNFTSAGNDHNRTIKSILTSGYGVNIGEQIYNKLTDDDIIKIRSNIIGVM